MIQLLKVKLDLARRMRQEKYPKQTNKQTSKKANKPRKCSMPPSEDGSLFKILFLFILVLALKEVGRQKKEWIF